MWNSGVQASWIGGAFSCCSYNSIQRVSLAGKPSYAILAIHNGQSIRPIGELYTSEPLNLRTNTAPLNINYI